MPPTPHSAFGIAQIYGGLTLFLVSSLALCNIYTNIHICNSFDVHCMFSCSSLLYSTYIYSLETRPTPFWQHQRFYIGIVISNITPTLVH